MIFSKAIALLLITFSFIAHSHVENFDILCEDIKHSDDVSICLIESVEEIKKNTIKALSNTSFQLEVKE